MRDLYWMPLVGAAALLAACGPTVTPKAEEAVPEKLADGLYEVSAEVTDLASTDNTTPATKLKKGEKQVVKACIAGGKPAPELFAEAAGDKCEIKNSYIHYGRISAQMSCTRAGASGLVMPAMMGSFKAQGFEGDITTLSYFSKDGDYRLVRKVSARRIGDCPAGGAAPTAG